MWKESETSIEDKIRINFEMKFPKEGECVMPYLEIGKVIEMKSFCTIIRCDDLILRYNGWCLWVN